MENSALINYHKTRDFSQKMSVTFEFIRQNFKSLAKSILFIAGPPVLLASLLMGSFFQDFFSASMSIGAGNTNAFQNLVLTPSFWFQILLMVVFLLTSTVATISTINNYILLYEEKQTHQIETGEVWDRVRKTFFMYLGTAVLFTILGVAVYLLMIIPVALLGAISPALVILGVMAFIVGIVYLIFSTSLVFIVRAYERAGFFEAIGRSFKLVQGKWWSTFGLIFVLYLIAVVVSYVFMIPWYIITVVTSLHNTGVEGFQAPGKGMATLSLVLFTLYYLTQMILYTLPNVGIAFQYFNLVERKEARGLMNQIESIGQAPPSTAAADKHY